MKSHKKAAKIDFLIANYDNETVYDLGQQYISHMFEYNMLQTYKVLYPDLWLLSISRKRLPQHNS